MNNQSRLSSSIWGYSLLAAALLALYVWVYAAGPFTRSFNPAAQVTWNDFWINAITVIAAGFSAFAAMLVLRCYHRSEPVYMVWLFFAIGLWIWTAAELTFMVLNLTWGDVPVPSLADLFWTITYFFFTAAFVRQYKVIYRPSLSKRILITAIGWLSILVMTFLVSFLASGSDMHAITSSKLVNYFYPVADFAIAVVAVYFIISFQRGALTRPWLGLFVFAVADSTYALLYESGMLTFTASTQNTISVLADTIYVAAYLVLAIGLLAHYLLVKYDPNEPAPSKLDAAAKA